MLLINVLRQFGGDGAFPKDEAYSLEFYRRKNEMVEAYIYDHVRTPRGKGRSSGSLHSITPIELASTTLRAIRDRNELDTTHVDLSLIHI